jgi:hypothetical protein
MITPSQFAALMAVQASDLSKRKIGLTPGQIDKIEQQMIHTSRVCES